MTQEHMDTDGDRLWLLTALLVLCCLLRGWFSACETALAEVNDAAVHARAEEDGKWKRLDRLIAKPLRLSISCVSSSDAPRPIAMQMSFSRDGFLRPENS